jgi:hypothetical protein
LGLSKDGELTSLIRKLSVATKRAVLKQAGYMLCPHERPTAAVEEDDRRSFVR